MCVLSSCVMFSDGFAINIGNWEIISKSISGKIDLFADTAAQIGQNNLELKNLLSANKKCFEKSNNNDLNHILDMHDMLLQQHTDQAQIV